MTNTEIHQELLENNRSEGFCAFTNFNEDEPATCMRTLELVAARTFMQYFIAPILIICTGGIFGLALFWSDKLRLNMFYGQVKRIENATHVKVTGVPGNIEALPLYASVLGDDRKQSFVYRFIKFEFKNNQFQPIAFKLAGTQRSILDKYGRGI